MNEQIKAGADIHAGDGGYQVGTQEKYDAFVKVRNMSLGKMRIRELAEQSGLEYNFDPMLSLKYEKFAELIIHECIQAAGPEDSYTDEWFKAKVNSVANIKRHFGIE